MIYLVTKNKSLKYNDIKIIEEEQSFSIIKNWNEYGFDTETSGFSPYLCKLLSVQIGNTEDQIVIDCTTIDVRDYKWFLEDSNRLAVGTNLKFDLQWMYHYKIIIPKVFDTYLAEKLLYLGYPIGIHRASLKATVAKYLGIELDKTIRGQIIWKGIQDENVVKYAAKDTEYEIPLMSAQKEELKKKTLLRACQLECEFVKVLAYIEYCGVKLDTNKWKSKMKKDLQNLKDAENSLNQWVSDFYREHKGKDGYCIVEKKIRIENEKSKDFEYSKTFIPLNEGRVENTAGGRVFYQNFKVKFPYAAINTQGDLFNGFNLEPQCTINWNSQKQVIPFLEFLGFNLETFDKETKQKKKSIESKVIEPQKDVSSIAPIYLKYKAAQKVVSTYGQNWLNNINPITGRIHPSYSQLMDTGRLSCGGGEDSDLSKYYHTKVKKINIQNVPSDPETRACFVSEEGNSWISRDFQGEESRIIASTADDPAMIELFKGDSPDVHSLVAKMSYPEIIGDTPIKDIKKKFHKWRAEAKGIEFAINSILFI